MREELIERLQEDETEINQFILVTEPYVMAHTTSKAGAMTLLTALIVNLLEHEKATEEDIDEVVKIAKKASKMGVEELLKETMKETLQKLKKELENM